MRSCTRTARVTAYFRGVATPALIVLGLISQSAGGPIGSGGATENVDGADPPAGAASVSAEARSAGTRWHSTQPVPAAGNGSGVSAHSSRVGNSERRIADVATQDLTPPVGGGGIVGAGIGNAGGGSSATASSTAGAPASPGAGALSSNTPATGPATGGPALVGSATPLPIGNVPNNPPNSPLKRGARQSPEHPGQSPRRGARQRPEHPGQSPRRGARQRPRTSRPTSPRGARQRPEQSAHSRAYCNVPNNPLHSPGQGLGAGVNAAGPGGRGRARGLHRR